MMRAALGLALLTKRGFRCRGRGPYSSAFLTNEVGIETPSWASASTT